MSTRPPKITTNPYFSSGPCRKVPDWSVQRLNAKYLQRSHRCENSVNAIQQLIEDFTSLLKLPSDYKLAIVPGSNTGAMEMAMWNLLGANKTTVLSWEAFGKRWLSDICDELKLNDVTTITSDFGSYPDTSNLDPNSDIVFVWNGTSSGVKVSNTEWIDNHKNGLLICDATSGIFAQDIPVDKLDVITFSWQKVLGGEAAHGVIILSPKAIKRLETYTPDRPIPFLFKLKKGGVINESIFKGKTINTPSMLCVADALIATDWVRRIGGSQELIKRTNKNYQFVCKWIKNHYWIDHLPENMENCSTTSMCFKFTDPYFLNLNQEMQTKFINMMCRRLENRDIAYDIKAYSSATKGLRIWTCGTTSEKNIYLLLEWIRWSYFSAKSSFHQLCDKK